MSVGIFVSDDKKSIIVGNPYVADHYADIATKGMSDEEFDQWGEANKDKDFNVIEGHKLVGKISLAVWRWEASDKNTVKESTFQPYQDVVEIDVPHGNWSFEHYYEVSETKDDDIIYSRLKLVEESCSKKAI